VNIFKFKKWLLEEKEESNSSKRNFFVLIGPPAVGKSSWIENNVKDNRIIISKDEIIEDVIFPKYNLANKDIFKVPTQDLEVGEEHPEKKKLGRLTKYTRFSKSKGKEVEELAFENAHAAGEELNAIYDSELKNAISSDVKNIVVDAIHMTRSNRKTTIDYISGRDDFNIIGVVFPFKGYEKQILRSAELRAKDFLERYGPEFDRGVSKSDYEEIYKNFEEPSKSEGFDRLITSNRFKKTDREIGISDETFNEMLVRNTKNLLGEATLSNYWKIRADSRSKHAKRKPGNKLDLEWAQLQQEKSRSMNAKIHKIFEKELQGTEELSEEISEFLEKVKKKRLALKKKMQEKKLAKLKSPKNLSKKKSLPNPYKDAKITSKYPYSKDRTGGVAKVYRKRSKQAGGATIAPGESFGPIGENQSNPLFDSLSDIQKENFFKLIGDVEEYDILKLGQRKRTKNILKYFNLSLQDAVELVKKCPVLSKPIQELLTAGTKGFIYLLDNGHILKLYQDDYSGGGDMYWYKGTKARMFSSAGNITDLPIYDEGEIKLDAGEQVNYVEMARVIPLSDFMEETRRSADDAESDYELCKDMMIEIEQKYSKKFFLFSQEKIASIFKDFMQKKKMYPSALTKNEFVSLAKTIYLFIKTGNYLHDSHVGNIGILPQSNPSNPVFVIFDN
jgi:hypothetical protein